MVCNPSIDLSLWTHRSERTTAGINLLEQNYIGKLVYEAPCCIGPLESDGNWVTEVEMVWFLMIWFQLQRGWLSSSKTSWERHCKWRGEPLSPPRKNVLIIPPPRHDSRVWGKSRWRDVLGGQDRFNCCDFQQETYSVEIIWQPRLFTITCPSLALAANATKCCGIFAGLWYSRKLWLGTDRRIC